MVVRAAAGARVVIRNLAVSNAGYTTRELTPSEAASAETDELHRLRGYAYERVGVREIVCDTEGEHVIDEPSSAL